MAVAKNYLVAFFTLLIDCVTKFNSIKPAGNDRLPELKIMPLHKFKFFDLEQIMIIYNKRRKPLFD